MSRVFSGAVLLPGETGDGLCSSFEIGEDSLRLIAGENELGTWGRNDCDVSPAGKGSFQMRLAGETLTFTPSSPSAFAEAMTVPLTPEPETQGGKRGVSYDYDAAIDEMIADVTPPPDPGSDEILSKPMIVGIVGVSTAVMTGLVTITMVI
ncbi:MAG: hypothetical protein BMS9Abin12_0424 [Acidimicrobiia bacterium]|nr:MAG: hypothetical protein BMS9Abin12_0424 [Acidimicrobiia bacterium]